MILPIVAYGDPILRKKTVPVEADFSTLERLIGDMFETMYHAKGVGLAAPQVGLSIRLFITDAAPMGERDDDKPDPETEPSEPVEDFTNFKKVFINPLILSEEGEKWGYEEGCLSIPNVREEVKRAPTLTVRYFDETGTEKTETYSGLKARIIQHEYDHIEGVLFIDRCSPLKRQLLYPKLQRIARGLVRTEYPMRFAKKERK